MWTLNFAILKEVLNKVKTNLAWDSDWNACYYV